MRIDAYTHLFPSRYFQRMQELVTNKGAIKRWLNLPTLWDVDARRKMVDSFGDYQQVLANSMPPLEFVAGPDKTPELARLANDEFAELVAKYPDQFPAFIASLPMNNPDAAVEEATRAIAQLGARGVQIFTNVNDRPLDSPEYLAIFETMAKHDLPIWLHPTRGPGFSDYKAEKKSKYEIWWTFGWPYETSAAMARMVFSGMMDELPNLKVLAHHLGAMVPYFEGRVGPGMDQLGKRTSDEDLSLVLKRLKKRPFDYFKDFYADTAVFGSRAATVCGLDFYPTDHVLFASDSPFDPERGPGYIRDTIKVLESIEMPDEKREAICFRNAQRLFKLA
jgi:predicted TIM-barrel fold metal-dependent hydrolase